MAPQRTSAPEITRWRKQRSQRLSEPPAANSAERRWCQATSPLPLLLVCCWCQATLVPLLVLLSPLVPGYFCSPLTFAPLVRPRWRCSRWCQAVLPLLLVPGYSLLLVPGYFSAPGARLLSLQLALSARFLRLVHLSQFAADPRLDGVCLWCAPLVPGYIRHLLYLEYVLQFGRNTLAPTSTSDLGDAPQSDRTVLPMPVVGARHAHP